MFEPGGRQVRGYDYGKLVEVRYIDVVPTGIEAPERETFLQQIRQQRLSEEYLRACRVGYVDDNGVGIYCDAYDFVTGKLEDWPKKAEVAS